MVPRNGVARLNPNGALDETFDPARQLSGTPIALSLLPDGKILIGVRVRWNLIQVYRCLSDGSLDSTFDNSPGFSLDNGTDDEDLALLPLPDGRLLVGGLFHRFGGIKRSSLARLLPSGGLDPDFNVSESIDWWTTVLGLAADGADGYLVAVRREDEAKMDFLRLRTNGDVVPNQLLSAEERQRLKFPVLADGRRVRVVGNTMTFYSSTGTVERVWTNAAVFAPVRARHYAALLSNGSLLISGIAPDLPDGRANFGLVHLSRGGKLKSDFAMPGGVSVPNLGIHQITGLTNGDLLVMGNFALVNGVRRSGMARLQPDGTTDPAFELRGIMSPDPYFVAQRNGRFLASGSVCPEAGQECHYDLFRFSSDGLRDTNFATLGLFCEQVVEAVRHPRAGILLHTAPGGPCWLYGGGCWLRRANAADGQVDWAFFVGIVARGLPGRLQHILPHALDDTTYLVGDFTHLNGTPCAGVARLRIDGTPDPGFQFAHPELLGYGALGAHVENDGRLTLLTTFNDHGQLLTIRPDGSLANCVRVAADLPQVDKDTLRFPDGSWLVSRTSPGVTLSRIGTDGRLLARRIVPFTGEPEGLAIGRDAGQRVLVGAANLITSSGPWSGLLRLKNDALVPVALRATASPEGRKLWVQGPAGQSVKLETSTDLTTWHEWRQTVLETSEAQVEVPPLLTNAWLYFRAVGHDN